MKNHSALNYKAGDRVRAIGYTAREIGAGIITGLVPPVGTGGEWSYSVKWENLPDEGSGWRDADLAAAPAKNRFAFDHDEISKNIFRAIRKAMKDGVTGMSVGNLHMVTTTPTNGPTGTNARYLYAETFREVLAKVKLPRGFEIIT